MRTEPCGTSFASSNSSPGISNMLAGGNAPKPSLTDGFTGSIATMPSTLNW